MTPPETEKTFRSYAPDKTNMREFTLRAIVLGLIMTVVLGAANMYLGLRAGMTIAATYPAAVIGMAIEGQSHHDPRVKAVVAMSARASPSPLPWPPSPRPPALDRHPGRQPDLPEPGN